MALISPDGPSSAMPGFLGYQDWYRHGAHEFPQGLLADMSYSKIAVRTTDSPAHPVQGAGNYAHPRAAHRTKA